MVMLDTVFVTTPATNFPLETTRFIGREALLEDLRRLICRPDARLITLTGPGGTGKTRLALKAAAGLVEPFEAGVYFVQLAAVTDPEVVLPTIVRALGLKEVSGQSTLETLRDHLGDRSCLLLLDNLEQVLGAAPAIAQLLAECAGLKVIATSRSVLHLSAELEFPVPPMALPERRDRPRASDVASSEAAALFVERARATQPAFALTDENAPQVADVCRLLDGLPLALELAAARLRALPLPALLRRLEHKLPILTGGPRDAPARQQTLLNTIRWSYDLLTQDEQVLLERLSVFRGCTLDAVETVCCAAAEGPRSSSVALPPLELGALDGVTSLVEKSLLLREELEDGQPWYRMLETVREFALERLEASGQAAALRRRHALYYLELAEAADEALHGPRQLVMLNRLEREHDNCRESLRWCSENGYAQPALRTAVALWWFWVVRGYAAEGRDWLTALIERFKPQGAAGPRSQLRLRVLEAAGHLASFQGDFAAARAYHEQNLPIVEELGDRSGLYRTLQNIGFVARQQEDFEAARKYLERCLEVAKAGGDPDEIGNALHNLGNVAHDQGDYERAIALFEESLPVLEQSGWPRGNGIAHQSLGIVALDQGDYERAFRETEVAIAWFEKAGDRRATSVGIANLGAIAMARRDYAAAERYLCESLRLVQELSDAVAIAGVLERFAALLAARGNHAQALRLAGAAATLREKNGAQLMRTNQLALDEQLQPAREALGDRAASAFDAGRALEIAEAIDEALGALAAPAAPKPAQACELTAREWEVAQLIAQGATNRQIADSLVITEGTAANHVLHILGKLGFSSRTQIAVWAAGHEGVKI